VVINISYFLSKQIVWNHYPHFNIGYTGKSVSTNAVWTNVAGTGVTT